MRKAVIAILLASLSLSTASAKPAKVKSRNRISNGASLTAKSAIAINLNNKKVLYSRNPNLKLPPASTTKLVTALVVLDKLNLNDRVRISRNAARTVPSKAHLRPGAYYTVKDLLCALLIASANDAAVALAEAVAGSEAEFANLTNRKARSLGAKNSNFLTASGLPKKGQYSTANDMALIASRALGNSVIKTILAQKYACITGSDGRKITLKNHNKLLWKLQSPMVLGKTGYTMNAKHCFVGVVHYRDKKVAVAILKSRTPWADVRAILPD